METNEDEISSHQVILQWSILIIQLNKQKDDDENRTTQQYISKVVSKDDLLVVITITN